MLRGRDPGLQLFLKLGKLVYQVHIGSDPLAPLFYSIVRFVDAQMRAFVQSVSNNEASGSTDPTLTVDKDAFSLLDTFVNNLNEVEHIVDDVGVVIPGYVNVFRFVLCNL